MSADYFSALGPMRVMSVWDSWREAAVAGGRLVDNNLICSRKLEKERGFETRQVETQKSAKWRVTAIKILIPGLVGPFPSAGCARQLMYPR